MNDPVKRLAQSVVDQVTHPHIPPRDGLLAAIYASASLMKLAGLTREQAIELTGAAFDRAVVHIIPDEG